MDFLSKKYTSFPHFILSLKWGKDFLSKKKKRERTKGGQKCNQK